MTGNERRRVVRHPVDMAGELHLSMGRSIPVRILNLGDLGALVSMTDLEDAVLEGERVALVHPLLEDGVPTSEKGRTVGAIVRVDLDFSHEGVARHLAIFFDGGAAP